MAMNNKVSGVRCQVSGEKSRHFAFLWNLKPKTCNLRRGFSLIELVVVIGIISVISSVVLVSNQRYGGSVLLQNLVYDIALSIRQAQVYGISVRGDSTGSFNVGYGMHFAMSDPTHYELFADANDNGLFDFDDSTFPPTSENVPPSPYTIGRGYHLKKLCAPAGTNTAECLSNSALHAQQLDVLYKRPEPDASIRISGTSALQDSGRIVVESPRGDVLSIVIEATGQIAVQ